MITQIDVDRITNTNKDELSNTHRTYQAVLCKLAAEESSIFAPWADIEAALENTVASTICLKAAREMRGNPYSPRLEIARGELFLIEGKQKTLDQSAIPGTFIMGRSGVTEAYRRKLDTQLDKTIDLAVVYAQLDDQIRRLEQQEYLFDMGLINQQGRSIVHKVEKKPYRPRSERVKAIRQAMMALSLDGEATLPTGETLSVWQQWMPEEKELAGIIRVVHVGEVVTEHRAESIQGVHLEQMQLALIAEFLKSLQ